MRHLQKINGVMQIVARTFREVETKRLEKIKKRAGKVKVKCYNTLKKLD